MSGPTAKVICDSVSPYGIRLTTIEVKYHRFVLPEVNTHRAFSRNVASNRAIPYKKLRDMIKADPAIPLSWPQEQKGMQGGEELNEGLVLSCEGLWLRAMDNAIESADKLHILGVHKSVINRLLEPFQYVTAIISATSWQGFFDQRDSKLAQPEIAELARAMRKAIEGSKPRRVGRGEWHLPYIDSDDLAEAHRLNLTPHDALELFKQISAARCARVSYLTHDGKRDWSADLSLFSRLATAYPPHWSPLEHVATPVPNLPNHKGNFHQWAQLRHDMESRGFGKDAPHIL